MEPNTERASEPSNLIADLATVSTCQYCGWNLVGSEIVHGYCGDCEKRGED